MQTELLQHPWTIYLVLTLKVQVLDWGGSGDEEPLGACPPTAPQ